MRKFVLLCTAVAAATAAIAVVPYAVIAGGYGHEKPPTTTPKPPPPPVTPPAPPPVTVLNKTEIANAINNSFKNDIDNTVKSENNNTLKNENVLKNSNTLKQGQKQAQRQGQSQSSRNVNRNTNRNRATANNAGVSQSVTYQDRLQAPGIAASFSSVTNGAPCDGVPVGVGGSVVGAGALIQIPRESHRCWQERQADRLMAWGCSNAAMAVYAGNTVYVALQNNPCEGRAVTRVVRAKY